MPPRPNPEALLTQLRAIAFFKDLATEVLTELARSAVWREYAAGEIIFLEGEAAEGLYLLQAGWLKVIKTSPDGREQVLRFVGPGETFNELGVFAQRPNPATAIALEPVSLWRLPRETLTQLLVAHPALAQQVIARLADRVLDLVALVTDLSLRPVTARLARLLLEGAVDDVLHRPRWYTQAELAARLGTVPDVIQRALQTLAADGLIEVQRHQIRIHNRAALEKLSA